MAMIVGMVALGPLWTYAWPGLAGLPAAQALVMASRTGSARSPAGPLMTAGHLLMLPLMLAAMLWRRHDYSHHH